MNLPDLPFLNKKKKEEYYIALLIKQKSIVSILLKSTSASLSIVVTKSASLDLETATVEDMIAACDEAISSIELSIDEGYTLEKTVFSVPYSWTDDDGSIKKERLANLKKISVELALKPMGFIVNIEALIKFFQDKEGVPLNAIFVEEGKSKIYIYLVKGGTIIETKSSALDDLEVEVAVERALKKVENFDKLPQKMILLYHEDIESRHQKFLNHSWTRDLPFLHLPQISLLEKGFENEAVVEAIASQLNVNIAGMGDVSGAEIMEGDASNMADKNENFGFVREKDVSEMSEEVADPVINDSSRDMDMGHEADDIEKNDKSLSGVGSVMALVMGLPYKAKSLFSFGSKSNSKVKLLVVPVAALVLFSLFMFLYYLLFLRAEVVIFLEGESVNDEVVVNLSEEDETSFDEKILHIDTVEQEVQGEATADATGVEEVGESAKGEVTILSSLNSSQTIKSGTVLTSSNGLKYTLDGDVQIASSSGVSDIKSAKGKITADEIGKEYNLPSNTKFSLGGFDTSSLEAKNDQALAGGSKEEKKIVSEKDLAGVNSQLLEDLFEEAVDVARGNVGDDEEIISVLLNSTLEDEKYSASEGDEAESVKVTAKVIYTLGIYKKAEAEKFISDARSDIPDGFVMSDDSDITLADVQEDDGDITGVLTYEVNFKPDVKFENLAEEIKGKSVGDAQELIKSNEGVSDVSVIFKNKLPLLPSVLPMRADQIDVVERNQES